MPGVFGRNCDEGGRLTDAGRPIPMPCGGGGGGPARGDEAFMGLSGGEAELLGSGGGTSFASISGASALKEEAPGAAPIGELTGALEPGAPPMRLPSDPNRTTSCWGWGPNRQSLPSWP